MAARPLAFVPLLFALLAAAPATQPSTLPIPANRFRVFGSLTFAARPDYASLGLEPVFEENRAFWLPVQREFDQPNERACRYLARQVASAKAPLVIDIAHWNVDARVVGDKEARASLDKLSRIIDWVRDERPQVTQPDGHAWRA